MDRIQAVYMHNKGRSFTLDGGDTIAVEILAALGSEAAWKTLFGAVYPLISETCMWYLTFETTLNVIFGGGDSATLLGGLSPTHFLNDLSQVEVSSAAAIVINWSSPR